MKMKFYVNDDEVLTEAEAKERILKCDTENGDFDQWVNENYTAMDIIDSNITLDFLECAYMNGYDPSDAEYYPVEISEEAARAIAAELLEKK